MNATPVKMNSVDRAIIGAIASLGAAAITLGGYTMLYNPPALPAPTRPYYVSEQVWQCRNDWSKCADNAQIMNEFLNPARHGIMNASCTREAEKLVKFGDAVWPKIGFAWFANGTEFVTTGVITVAAKDARIQNMFGAMEHKTVLCQFDMRTLEVKWASID